MQRHVIPLTALENDSSIWKEYQRLRIARVATPMQASSYNKEYLRPDVGHITCLALSCRHFQGE
jgi:hypothetical protein